VAAGISTGVLTLIVLVFGEITPKTCATINAEKIALANAKIIYTWMVIATPLIFILIQTCVHYAMFEDECYLQSQLEALKQAIRLLMTQYRTEDARPDVKAES
jgi:Mg2+/Co2+ transporter CorB